ncbi:MAG: exopolysaccharide biosynthesis protein [Chlamydiae bacterium]|nr:exopolysaccharide biosynthesis protein [Chlamydiota bacterium]
MRKVEKFKTLEEGILLLQEKAQHTCISIEDILFLLPGKGRALALILLSLPFCQPLQIPGLSIPFGLSVAFIGIRMAFGKRIWLPKSILSKTIKGKTIRKIADKALFLTRKMKRWIHPRLSRISRFPYAYIINGTSIFLLGILLAAPLPIPLSNLIAAWSVFLIAMGILEDDGVIILLGYSMAFFTISFFVVIILFIKHIF